HTHRASTQISPLSLHDALPISMADRNTDQSQTGNGRGALAGGTGALHSDGKHAGRVQGVGEHLAIARLEDIKRKQRLREKRGIRDRKSTRLNSSHQIISYAVFF